MGQSSLLPCLVNSDNVVIAYGTSPLRLIPGNSCGGGNNNGRRGGVGLFCKSGENTIGNVGCVVGGTQDNNNYGDYNNCLEDDVKEGSYQLARDLALGIIVVEKSNTFTMCLFYSITCLGHTGCPDQAQALPPIMWGWGRCTWFGRRQPIGDARGKSHWLPWLAGFWAYCDAAGGLVLYVGPLSSISIV